MISSIVLAVMLSADPANAEPTTVGPGDAYTIENVAPPKDCVMEVGALRYIDGEVGSPPRLAVATRRGEIWMLSNPDGDLAEPKWTRYAEGLHEVLGLAWKDGSLYATQRPEVTKLTDDDRDGRADSFELYANGWGISGDYHEYAFGTNFLPAGTPYEGEIWLGLCLTGSFGSKVPYRGWGMRVVPQDGSQIAKTLPITSGVRSPGGIAFNPAGDVFYSENQGPWNGPCAVKHMRPKKFVGHPGGFEWYSTAEEFIGPKPTEPESGSFMMTEADKIPELEPPAILMPYDRMGKSTSGLIFDTTEGRFGDWKNADGTGQAYVCDQSGSTVMRLCFEKVADHYQGACFPMLAGFGSGNLAIEQFPTGTVFVGGTNRGWGSVGKAPFALERVRFNGNRTPSLERIGATNDGFELTFTEPVGDSALDVASYAAEAFRYVYHSSYGGPEVDEWVPNVVSATRTSERSVRLKLDKFERDFIYHMSAAGVLTSDGTPIDQPTGYYTLNYIPSE